MVDAQNAQPNYGAPEEHYSNNNNGGNYTDASYTEVPDDDNNR